MGPLRNGIIEPEVRVAIEVRILSGTSYLEMLMSWQVARRRISQAFSGTMEVLFQDLEFQEFRETEEVCTKLVRGFAQSRRAYNLLLGCIGTIDSTLIRFKKPRALDFIDLAN